LRQLVKAGFSQKLACFSDTLFRIMDILGGLVGHFSYHGAKLVENEDLTVHAHALLAKEGLGPVKNSYEQGNKKKEGPNDKKPQEAEEYIKAAL
jgi:hypothetical protein